MIGPEKRDINHYLTCGDIYEHKRESAQLTT